MDARYLAILTGLVPVSATLAVTLCFPSGPRDWRPFLLCSFLFAITIGFMVTVLVTAKEWAQVVTLLFLLQVSNCAEVRLPQVRYVISNPV